MSSETFSIPIVPDQPAADGCCSEKSVADSTDSGNPASAAAHHAEPCSHHGAATGSEGPACELKAADATVEIDDAALIGALREVVDPELMINIVDLGLVYSINHTDQKVLVEMTLTSPACPAG